MKGRVLAVVFLVVAGGCFYNTCDTYVCKAATDCPLDQTYCCVEGRCIPARDVDAGKDCK